MMMSAGAHEYVAEKKTMAMKAPMKLHAGEGDGVRNGAKELQKVSAA